MATTVKASNLTVTITEDVSLSTHSYGNTRTKTFNTQGQADQRIMNIATAGTTILHLSTVDDRGQIVVNDFGYFRITNLDDTNYVTLEFYLTADHSYYVKLEAGESYLLMSPDADITCGAEEVPSLVDIARIIATANTSAVDIEYLVVTTGDAT